MGEHAIVVNGTSITQHQLEMPLKDFSEVEIVPKDEW